MHALTISWEKTLLDQIVRAIFDSAIRRFESSRPSHAVRSLGAMSRPREFARRSRGLRRRWRVSVAGFSCFKEAFVEIGALVSGRGFSISVFLSQRLSSNSPETGL